MADISASTWTEVDEANTAVSPLGFADGNSPNKLAANIRATRGAIKRAYNEINAMYVSTGTASALVLTYAQAAPSYVKGKRISFFPNVTNTGACTLNINSLGAKSILRQDGSALVAGDIVSGQLVEVYFDGAAFRINGSSASTNATFTGTVTANAFVGNGAAVTHVNAAKISGIDLTGLVQVGRKVLVGDGLTGGGDLSADRTIALGTPATITTSTTNSVGAGTHSHAMTLTSSDVSTALGYTPSMNGLPVGAMIMMWGNGTTVPPGFLLANGAVVTTAYPQLRTYLLANGAPLSGSDPKLPDMGGYFPRGWRPGQTVDSGRVFGSVQADAFPAHSHFTAELNTTVGTANPDATSAIGTYGSAGNDFSYLLKKSGDVGVADVGLSSSAGSGSETRPDNQTVTYWVKAYDTPIDTATLNAAQVVNDVSDARARVATLETNAAQKYVSGVLTMTLGGNITVTHGLTGDIVVDVWMVRTATTGAQPMGYASGDKVKHTGAFDHVGSAGRFGIGVARFAATPTQIQLQVGSGGWGAVMKDKSSDTQYTPTDVVSWGVQVIVRKV